MEVPVLRSNSTTAPIMISTLPIKPLLVIGYKGCFHLSGTQGAHILTVEAPAVNDNLKLVPAMILESIRLVQSLLSIICVASQTPRIVINVFDFKLILL